MKKYQIFSQDMSKMRYFNNKILKNQCWGIFAPALH